MPKATFYWYYLADVNIKVGIQKEGEKSIKIVKKIGDYYPSKEKFNKLMK